MSIPTRPHFFATLIAALGFTSALVSAVSASDLPLHLAPGPQLFIDDYLIESQSNVDRVAKHPQRLPEPVVTGKEDHNYQPYVTVLRDDKSGKFRLWFGVPAAEPKSQPSHLAYMESDDGIHFKRPAQILADPGGLVVRFGASILDDGSAFPDPDKRFKFGWYCDWPGGGGLMVATSPDGLTWTPIAPNGPVLPHNHDINNIYFDPYRKHCVATISTIQTGPTWAGQRRITQQSFSDDLIHWQKPWNVLEPDDKKDEEGTQFYAMAGFLSRGDLLIGLVKILRDEVHADPTDPNSHGIGYTTLAYTRDGIHWTRDREPFLSRGAKFGDWDFAHAWADCQLTVGDEVYIYYGGYARGHKTSRFTERQIGLAKMRSDRYVARVAGEQEAVLITKPFILTSPSMTINARIGGRLRVTLLSDKQSIQSDAITGDSLRHPVHWSADGSALKSKAVRLEFRFSRGDLYAFTFESPTR